MRPRENQLIVVILLLIVITAIVTLTCVNLMELVNMFYNSIDASVTRFSLGF